MTKQDRNHHLLILVTLGACALLYLFPQLGIIPILIMIFPRSILVMGKGITPRSNASQFAIPLIFFFITSVIAAFVTYDYQSLGQKLWLITGSIMLFITAVEWLWASEKNQQIAYTCLAWFGVIVTVYFVLTNFLGLPLHQMHPNVVGGLLLLALPFTANEFLTGRNAPLSPFPFSLFPLPLTMLGLLLTTSRGAWIGAVAMVGAVALYKIAKDYFQIGLLVSLVVGVVGVYFALELIGGISGLGRATLITDTLMLSGDTLYTGSGLGSYPLVHATYALLVNVPYIIHSHNLFLNILFEQGIFALITLLWIAILAWRTYFPADSGFRADLTYPALAILGISVHSLLDDPLYGSRGVLLMWLPLAFFAVKTDRSETLTQFKQLLTFLLLSASLILLIPALRAKAFTNMAAVRQQKVELSSYDFSADFLQDNIRYRTNMQPITDQYRHALSIAPNDPNARRRLGQIQLTYGFYEQTSDLLAPLSPSPTVDQMRGEAALMGGRTTEASGFWKNIRTEQNQLNLREFWYDLKDEPNNQRLIKENIP